MFYEKKENNDAQCGLCNHRCLIREGKRGICRVRENREGALYSLVYGMSAAEQIDPIEKKPFFNFYPGSNALSIGTLGCNFKCLHCQNYHLSQPPHDIVEVREKALSPEKIISLALQYGCKIIAYTYNEPTVFYEYAYDTARLAREREIKNVFVTNGYISPEALRQISPFIDGANIDLKSFREDFYQKICGAKLQPVLDSIKLYKELGIWVEVTTLLIPTHNDSDGELYQVAEFIKGIGEEIPWHISQYYPTHPLNNQPRTPIKTLRRAREIGREAGLRYVYQGNVPGEKGESTFCYQCQKLLIHRTGYQILESKIQNSSCPFCGAKIDGEGLF